DCLRTAPERDRATERLPPYRGPRCSGFWQDQYPGHISSTLPTPNQCRKCVGPHDQQPAVHSRHLDDLPCGWRPLQAHELRGRGRGAQGGCPLCGQQILRSVDVVRGRVITPDPDGGTGHHEGALTAKRFGPDDVDRTARRDGGREVLPT